MAAFDASGAAAGMLGVGERPGLPRPPVGRFVFLAALIAGRTVLGQLLEAHGDGIAEARGENSGLVLVAHLVAAVRQGDGNAGTELVIAHEPRADVIDRGLGALAD